MILEIVLEAEAHDGNVEFVDDADKLLDAVLVQKLTLVYKHAVGPWLLTANQAKDVGIVLDRDRWPAQADARGNVAHLIPVVESRREEHHRFVLFLVIMGHF
ncbi:hypothetical protein D3C77_584790 [compost metagenome]